MYPILQWVVSKVPATVVPCDNPKILCLWVFQNFKPEPTLYFVYYRLLYFPSHNQSSWRGLSADFAVFSRSDAQQLDRVFKWSTNPSEVFLIAKCGSWVPCSELALRGPLFWQHKLRIRLIIQLCPNWRIWVTFGFPPFVSLRNIIIVVCAGFCGFADCYFRVFVQVPLADEIGRREMTWINKQTLQHEIEGNSYLLALRARVIDPLASKSFHLNLRKQKHDEWREC